MVSSLSLLKNLKLAFLHHSINGVIRHQCTKARSTLAFTLGQETRSSMLLMLHRLIHDQMHQGRVIDISFLLYTTTSKTQVQIKLKIHNPINIQNEDQLGIQLLNMHEYRRFGLVLLYSLLCSALSIDLIFPLSIIKQFPS